VSISVDIRYRKLVESSYSMSERTPIPFPSPDSEGDMSPLAPVVVPIADERYGAGVRINFPEIEVTLFARPPREEVIAGELVQVEEEIAADQDAPAISNIKTETNTESTTERQPRVEISGRVGRDPRVRETTQGTLIAKFPLAEHPEGLTGPTVWHTIVAFKERATFVRDNVRKGQEVKVIGYVNDHDHNGKTYQEINAVVVKPPKPLATQ
jgi:single-stranded DNA-binding protein